MGPATLLTLPGRNPVFASLVALALFAASPTRTATAGITMEASAEPAMAKAKQGRGLKIKEPPVPVVAATYTENGYNIHIYETPGARNKMPSERSVLLLGTFSDPEAVINSRNYINPATGKRFDVIIGLAADDTAAEAKRVILEDHLNADRNAAALKMAIVKHFGAPLGAGSLDTHSNGTTVGITGILGGAFSGVKQLNVLGPDIGYGGAYLNRDSLSRLKQAGVQSVDVYRNRGDIVPALGLMSELMGQSLSGSYIAAQTTKSVKALMDMVTAPRDADLPRVRQFVMQTSLGPLFDNHYVVNYLNARAGFIKDSGRLTPVSDTGPTDAKGVRIFIDDEILAKALSSATAQENDRLFMQLSERLRNAGTESGIDRSLADFTDTLKLQFKRASGVVTLNNVILVSMKSLLEGSLPYASHWRDLPDNIKHPGGITRIHGYLLDREREDIFLVGQKNPGEEPVVVDDLVVGIGSVWQEGKVPFCSLDPDPENFAGQQKVRLNGIPGDSAFALKMLEADYAMKKIMAGTETVDVPAYRSYRSIIAERPGGEVANRFWLYPVQPGAGEIQMSPDNGGALFAGGVQVLSEQMVKTREGLLGTGKVDAGADEAAASFTRCYPDIARLRPEFQRLQSLFDIVLLARIWQHADLKSPLLERFVQLPHDRVEIPTGYQGIEVMIRTGPDTGIILQGGVQAKPGAGARSMLAYVDPDMLAIRKALQHSSDGGVARPVADAALQVIAPDLSHRDTANLAVTSVLGKVATGNIAGAKGILEEAIRENPFNGELLMLRAFIGYTSGDMDGARQDALNVRQLDGSPDTLTATALLLFQCDVLEGKPDDAMRQIEWAIRNDPSSVRSRIFRAQALMQLERPAEARQELLRAVQMDPTSPVALARLGIMEIGEGWTTKGQKLIKKAYAMSKALGQDGPEIKSALAMAELAAAGFGNMKTHLGKVESFANDALAHPACDPGSALTALVALSASAMLKGEWDKADRYVADARRLVPFSPELLIYAAETALELKREDLYEKYLAEAERLAPGHPAVQSLKEKGMVKNGQD